MPFSQEISLLSVLLVIIVSFFIGILLGKSSPFWLRAGIAMGALLIVIRGVLMKNPQIEYQLFPYDWYALVRPWWGYPVAMFLTGAAIPLTKHFSVRVLSKAAAGIVFLVSVRTVAACLSMDYGFLMSNFPDEETGLLKQQTTYTCGPACAAMLLHFEGIRTSEGEMAVHCLTNAASATDQFNVRRGIRQKLGGNGKNVRLEFADDHFLSANGHRPMMAVVRFEHLLDHWVVIKSVSENGNVEVLDPNGNHVIYSAEDFKDLWKNSVLYIDSPSNRLVKKRDQIPFNAESASS